MRRDCKCYIFNYTYDTYDYEDSFFRFLPFRLTDVETRSGVRLVAGRRLNRRDRPVGHLRLGRGRHQHPPPEMSRRPAIRRPS